MNKFLLWLTAVTTCLAACGGPASPTPTPTPTPDELLDRAAEVLTAITSAQFVLTREGAPAVLDPGTNTTYSEISGQYQAPDRASATVKVTLLGTLTQVQIIWLPEGAFMTNPLTQQFGPAPDAVNALDAAALFDPKSGIPSILSDGIQSASWVGMEKIEEREAYHIHGQVTGDKLASFTAGTLSADTSYPVDVWIEAGTWNVLQAHVTEPDGNGWLLSVFGINEPVEIKAP